ncbi:hypothetical protein [Caballeronia catudaia]|uniref:hypothetical protein n=1 Tax=Caballeronia catudaia TaxID=1777136 RepID=UPI000772AD4E|nr:hypothetical protein [Caballeronia catudaia]
MEHFGNHIQLDEFKHRSNSRIAPATPRNKAASGAAHMTSERAAARALSSGMKRTNWMASVRDRHERQPIDSAVGSVGVLIVLSGA